MTKPRPKEREVWMTTQVSREIGHGDYVYTTREKAEEFATFMNQRYPGERWEAKKYILTEADR